MTRKSNLIFDLDGTLVDSYPGLQTSLNHTLVSLGRDPVDIARVKQLVGRGLENLIRTALNDESLVEKGLRLFRESYEEAHLSGTHLLPEVSETVSRLSAMGIRMAIASNKPSNYTRNILIHLGMDRYFEFCSGPDHGYPPKPEPSMLRAIMQRMNLSHAETIYVGDMVLDAETAANAGVRLALVATGGSSYEELCKVQADFLFRKFSELLRIF